MRYIPHTDEDVARMLRVIGKPSIASLFEHIPEKLRARRALDIAPLDEGALLDHLGELGARNQPAMGSAPRAGEPSTLSFLGAGMVPHHIPSAVDALLTRAEWYTSYTPYQPELSQGTLQAIFEFQTIVCELLDLDVANASMYDGASAAAEAVLMARRATGRRRTLLAGALHPQYTHTIETYLAGLEHGEPHDSSALARAGFGKDGRVALAAVEAELRAGDVACVLVQTPNFFGVVEELQALSDLAHQHGALSVVASAEPVAFGVLRSPGALGADIACAEGQGLAIPPTCGGPSVGLFGARAALTRQMPGRLVGETSDKDGRRGYVLTLATREQHIRREKATSNICTNTGLVALAFTIHLALLGRRGLTEMARLNLAKAEYAKRLCSSVRGFRLAFSGPTFNEFTLRVRGGNARQVAAELADGGIYAGVPATQPGFLREAEFDDHLIVAVTERHSKADIDRLARALDEVCP